MLDLMLGKGKKRMGVHDETDASGVAAMTARTGLKST
jgi:hypothetical protein